MFQITRRGFITGLGTAMISFPWIRQLFGATPSKPNLKVTPFPLQQIRLLPGLFLDAADRNRRYMLRIEPDRLLHMFRITAGLPSSAEPLGGWEQPVNELRGHFTGHYLSACAMIGAGMGDESFTKRGALIVHELAKCQKEHGNGYLSAFPE